jgi:hypothetical protein
MYKRLKAKSLDSKKNYINSKLLLLFAKKNYEKYKKYKIILINNNILKHRIKKKNIIIKKIAKNTFKELFK